MEQTPRPCECREFNPACLRLGKPTVQLWQLCAGINCSPIKSEKFRRTLDGLPAPVNASEPASRTRQCTYLGAEAGERKSCSTCAGRVELKLYQCLCPSHAASPATTLQDCKQCKDYEPLVCPAKSSGTSG